MSHSADPLLSPDWFRVAELRPMLRPGLSASVQRVRGQVWHVITDPASGRHHRFNPVAHRLLAACDGTQTLDEIWAEALGEDADEAPSQGDTLQLVARAFQSNLLTGDLPPDADALLRRQARVRQRRRARLNPLAFRVSLWDLDAWLSRLAPGLRHLGHPALRAAAALLLLVGLVLAVGQAGDLALEWRRQAAADALSAQGGGHAPASAGRLLLLMWLVWPVVKALHEAAHAVMLKRYGGAVHEVGVTLLLGNPVPYVDASASAAFSRRRHRVAVAAAGIVAEALIASAALLLWVLLEPGLMRDAMLAVVAVAGLSTLLVNGNPLLRFDGYHVLCEAAGLPNLAVRATAHWAWLARRHLLGLTQPPDDPPAPGETPWLLVYAPLSWLYRTVLLLALAFALADFSPLAGTVLLAAGAWLALGRPLWAVLRWLTQTDALQGRRTRALATTAAAVLVAAATVFVLPLPDRTQVMGVVALPDDATLRSAVDGDLLHYAQRDGDYVTRGTVIAQLDAPELRLQWAQARSLLAQHRIERLQQFGRSPAATAAAQDAIARQQAEVERLQRRVEALTLRAPVSGRLVLDARQRPPGIHVRAGDTVAWVLPSGPPRLLALVPHTEIERVRARPGEIAVELAHADGERVSATLAGMPAAASPALPSPALGESAGGPLPIDPSDRSGRTAREPLFQFDLRLPAHVTAHVGARARVAFDHGHTTLASMVARHWRQAFLRHFAH